MILHCSLFLGAGTCQCTPTIHTDRKKLPFWNKNSFPKPSIFMCFPSYLSSTTGGNLISTLGMDITMFTWTESQVASVGASELVSWSLRVGQLEPQSWSVGASELVGHQDILLQQKSPLTVVSLSSGIN